MSNQDKGCTSIAFHPLALPLHPGLHNFYDAMWLNGIRWTLRSSQSKLPPYCDIKMPHMTVGESMNFYMHDFWLILAWSHHMCQQMNPFRLWLVPSLIFKTKSILFFRYSIYSSNYSWISSWQTLLQVQQQLQQHLPQSFRISPPHQLLTLQLVKNLLLYLQTGKLPRTLMERYTTIIL